MRAKFVILCLLPFFILGCDRFRRPPIIKTEVVQLRVPMLYCPAPDQKLLQRPVLPIHQLNTHERRQYDKVVKAYVASIKVLQNYSKKLELSLEQYDEISKQYAKMREQFIKDWNNIRALAHKIDPKDIDSFSKGIPVPIKK